MMQSREATQRLPLIANQPAHDASSFSRQSNQVFHNQLSMASGRGQHQNGHIMTPLQTSKILVKVAAGAPGIDGGHDFSRRKSHLPGLHRAKAEMSLRKRGSQLPQSSAAASTQHKTPREQQLGVLQLAMWQRVQRISHRASVASQTQQMQGLVSGRY